ncbi:SpoIIE family protein phosphatase [Nocardia jinanensis]|uniref:Stage II sporulation protein E n=1 Tax=Nocardia jinanensis TaxID=382504 RepID=A0A917VKC5_9NOCA|nr:SpoIIE family protein phosphatase [Nocardia jinanensis]GGK92925.1 stage II sporulation protein E [Nocardia jinanensis]
MHEDGFIGRIEWAMAGRPLPGQDVSGDRCLVLDLGTGAGLFAVLDGLGHGAAAAEAVDRATRVLAENRTEPLDVLMVLCHRAMSDTRGAAVTLALFGAEETQWLSVGNVESHVLTASPTGPQVSATVLQSGGIVGYRLPALLQPQTVPVRPGDLLLMSTDGVEMEPGQGVDLAKSTAEIVQELLNRHAKDTDDALVLAARVRGVSNGITQREVS